MNMVKGKDNVTGMEVVLGRNRVAAPVRHILMEIIVGNRIRAANIQMLLIKIMNIYLSSYRNSIWLTVKIIW